MDPRIKVAHLVASSAIETIKSANAAPSPNFFRRAVSSIGDAFGDTYESLRGQATKATHAPIEPNSPDLGNVRASVGSPVNTNPYPDLENAASGAGMPRATGAYRFGDVAQSSPHGPADYDFVTDVAGSRSPIGLAVTEVPPRAPMSTAQIVGGGLLGAGAVGGGAYGANYAMSPEETYANQLRAMANNSLGTNFRQTTNLDRLLGR